jgi:hypothetical protein
MALLFLLVKIVHELIDRAISSTAGKQIKQVICCSVHILDFWYKIILHTYFFSTHRQDK